MIGKCFLMTNAEETPVMRCRPPTPRLLGDRVGSLGPLNSSLAQGTALLCWTRAAPCWLCEPRVALYI